MGLVLRCNRKATLLDFVPKIPRPSLEACADPTHAPGTSCMPLSRLKRAIRDFDVARRTLAEAVRPKAAVEKGPN
jgi:hypothetical protein